MKRNFIHTAAIAIALMTTSLPSQAFSLFGWLGSDKNSVESMIEFIPASSPLVFTGVSTEEMVTSSDDLMAATDLTEVGEQVASLLVDVADGSTAMFLEALITDYYSTAEQGGLALYKKYGFDPKGASVFYVNGLYPVFRVAVNDEAALLSVLKEAANDADFELTERNLNGDVITQIQLTEFDDIVINLGILAKDGVLTISGLSSLDSSNTLSERFAISKPAQTLTTSDWKNDAKTYGYDDTFQGYFSFLSLTESILNPSSLAHSQFIALTGSDTEITDMFDEQCRSEFISIVENSPRIVFGSQNYKVKDNQVDIDFSYTLEIKHQKVLEQLSMLQGFLPSYVTEDEELIVGLALGLDVDKLTPVLTELWTMFTTAEYNCDAIIEVQEQLQSANPAIMAMFTGMAQGLKGASFGLYDVIIDDSLMLGGTFDAIATVSTEKPELLLSLLTSYVPFFQGIDIALDGTPTSLESLGVPVPASLAVQGNHIVLYTGEKSEKVAASLKGEALKSTGITAFKLDYQGLGELMVSGAGPFAELSGGDYESCEELYTNALMLSQLPFMLTGVESFTDEGSTVNWSIEMDMSKLVGAHNSVEGEYELAYLDYDCSWVDIGGEEILADGTGRYYDYDETYSCEASESTYTWEQTATSMNQIGITNTYRDTCDSDWYEEEPFDFECQILASDDAGFYCLERFDDENTLYHYTRK